MESNLNMNDRNKTIIDAIIKKAKRVCPQSLAMIGVYGSVATGDTYEKSDLDLMILINDDDGWALGTGFILDDVAVGYDIYCTNWAMIEGDAECNHAHLTKLMDVQPVYIKDKAAVEKLDALKEKVNDVLQSDKRYEKAESALAQAKQMYAEVMLSRELSEARTFSAEMICFLLDAVMLWNGRYFKRGIKRTFEELAPLSLPENFEKSVEDVVTATDIAQEKQAATELMTVAVSYLKREKSREKPSSENITGSYEEMYSNWRNKVEEAEHRNDRFASFMNLASLQAMLQDIAEEVSIDKIDVLQQYSPSDLKHNVEVYDEALSRYLLEYEKAGITAKHYANAEAFAQAYAER